MTSHIGLMVVFAVCISTVFATLQRDAPREQLKIGARIFGGLVLGAYLVGWILYGLFG